MVRRSARSKAEDDAEATSHCPKGYTLMKCSCESYDKDPNGCDGSIIRIDDDGESCVAYNSAVGRGVEVCNR